jgi:glycosyltransferase involved in cell wall biosynthesis
VLVVAQHAPWKGHLDVLAALPLIRTRLPDVCLLMVGAAWTRKDAACSRRIRRRAEDPALGGRIFLLPPSPAIERYYWAADLLVLASRGEPFGRVVLEAFAAGLPAVASEDSGVAELLRPVCPELLFPAGDPAALARTVLGALAADPETRARWIEDGRMALNRACAADVG